MNDSEAGEPQSPRALPLASEKAHNFVLPVISDRPLSPASSLATHCVGAPQQSIGDALYEKWGRLNPRDFQLADPLRLTELRESKQRAQEASLVEKKAILDDASVKSYQTLEELVAFWQLVEACAPCQVPFSLGNEDLAKIARLIIRRFATKEDLEKIFTLVGTLINVCRAGNRLEVVATRQPESLPFQTAESKIAAVIRGLKSAMLYYTDHYVRSIDESSILTKVADGFACLAYDYLETHCNCNLYSFVCRLSPLECAGLDGDCQQLIECLGPSQSRILALGRICRNSEMQGEWSDTKRIIKVFQDFNLQQFDNKYKDDPEAIEDLRRAFQLLAVKEEGTDTVVAESIDPYVSFLERWEGILSKESYTPISYTIYLPLVCHREFESAIHRIQIFYQRFHQNALKWHLEKANEGLIEIQDFVKTYRANSQIQHSIDLLKVQIVQLENQLKFYAK